VYPGGAVLSRGFHHPLLEGRVRDVLGLRCSFGAGMLMATDCTAYTDLGHKHRSKHIKYIRWWHIRECTGSNFDAL
jgi:hypothetical protein